MESAAAAAEVGEASLLDSKVQCCDGAVGRALFVPVLFLAVLRKALDAGRFVSCYRCFYKLQPQLTRSIYDQFISQLQTSIKEEIQEVKNEGNLEGLFSLLDKIVEEAKDREEPAWYGWLGWESVPARPPGTSWAGFGCPVGLMLQGRVRRILCSARAGDSSVCQHSTLSVAGWERLHAELCGLCSFQAITKEQRELIMALQELQ
uniref:Uncharacterized protein n=1 Tax=Zonotrichia albicollis TaxID=44394 RepID=A0A8D2LYV9_ZONAL